MLLFTLAISYIERLYRARLRRRAKLERIIANAQLQYYYLPTVRGYQLEALTADPSLDKLPQKPAVSAVKKGGAARHSN